MLLAADLGPAMAARLAAGVRSRAPRTREEAIEALVSVATSMMSKNPRELNLTGNPACILLYGVNGAGKTTTAGKLADRLRKEGRKPLVVAADTYRAAGIEQMVAWAERAGVPHFDGSSGADPASVVFDGVQIARNRGLDAVLVDTAGRL
ncbi:MAG TPA: zeta toxin family protein, partial [Methylomirabilota bacterium]|nr:zeta toxin family protein [Methylomirabilota bacterium]